MTAALDDGPAIALFMPAPGQWRMHGDAPAKIDFWRRNLEDLGLCLAALNVPLKFCAIEDWSRASEALAGFCRRHDVRAVHVNAEWGVNERRRDASVAERLARDGIQWTTHHGATLLRPGTITTGKGECYKVFTPYARVCRERLAAAPPRPGPEPRPQSRMPAPPDPIPSLNAMLGDAADAHGAPRAQPGHAPRPDEARNAVAGETPHTGDALRALWPAGADAAARRLDDFIEVSIDRYQENRDLPGVDGTSRLSPYLAAGVISPGACLRAALSANHGEMDSGRVGIRGWITELLWREFYLHLLAAHPALSMHRPMRPETEAIPWRDADDDWQAWRAGRTGFPIIDAAMRQLAAMGWMHNRLRMMTAMFLSKNLLLDWRKGEAWFMAHLIDGDLASNNGGWQWSASTGTDAVPYFRVFNPETQSRKFDPRGRFLRHWLPELADLDDRDIHAPSDAQRAARGYPARIVDLRASRLRAIEAYAGVSKKAGG
ncbi:Deoxyribodipyrimidine photolyase [Bordetella sputigena]